MADEKAKWKERYLKAAALANEQSARNVKLAKELKRMQEKHGLKLADDVGDEVDATISSARSAENIEATQATIEAMKRNIALLENKVAEIAIFQNRIGRLQEELQMAKANFEREKKVTEDQKRQLAALWSRQREENDDDEYEEMRPPGRRMYFAGEEEFIQLRKRQQHQAQPEEKKLKRRRRQE